MPTHHGIEMTVYRDDLYMWLRGRNKANKVSSTNHDPSSNTLNTDMMNFDYDANGYRVAYDVDLVGGR